jgi:hypothetical protein
VSALILALATVLVTLPDQSTLDVHGSLRLVQVREGDRHTLGFADRDGVTPLRIPRSSRPLEGDLGPGPDGRAVVVYSRCRSGRRCSLWMYRVRSRSETRLRGASGTAPTVWSDRIAWTRDGAVWTRRLGSSSIQRVTPPARGVGVEELELAGNHLAMSLRRIPGEIEDHPDIEIWLDGRMVARTAAGEGGQLYRGLSFAAGRLGFNRSCYADPSCGFAYRYRLATGTYERARSENLSGFALTPWGYAGVDVRSDVSFTDGDPACAKGCVLYEDDAVDWRPMPRRLAGL